MLAGLRNSGYQSLNSRRKKTMLWCAQQQEGFPFCSKWLVEFRKVCATRNQVAVHRLIGCWSTTMDPSEIGWGSPSSEGNSKVICWDGSKLCCLLNASFWKFPGHALLGRDPGVDQNSLEALSIIILYPSGEAGECLLGEVMCFSTGHVASVTQLWIKGSCGAKDTVNSVGCFCLLEVKF